MIRLIPVSGHCQNRDCPLKSRCSVCQDYYINHYTFDYYNTLRNLIFVFVDLKKAPTHVGA